MSDKSKCTMWLLIAWQRRSAHTGIDIFNTLIFFPVAARRQVQIKSQSVVFLRSRPASFRHVACDFGLYTRSHIFIGFIAMMQCRTNHIHIRRKLSPPKAMNACYTHDRSFGRSMRYAFRYENKKRKPIIPLFHNCNPHIPGSKDMWDKSNPVYEISINKRL